MAIFDVPAMINYVKAVTGAPKVAYIGHSMGTTIMFYLAVNKPDWVDRSVSVFVALAPVTLPVNSRCPLIKLSSQIGLFQSAFEFLKIHEIFSEKENKASFKLICGHIPSICEQGAGLIASKNLQADDEVRF